MNDTADLDEQAVADAVAEAAAVAPVGSGTHREVGGPPPTGTELRAPTGIVAYEPAELTVTLGAGTTVTDLAAVLAESDQECVLDPRDPRATVGGTLATGLSGHRRLRYGPLRDRVLEVRFATADGRLVRGGGPTVKNVTGYDLPRLLVGSLGTIGVLTRLILRCQPRPVEVRWGASTDDPDEVRARCFRPSSVLWDGTRTSVLLEGDPRDIGREAAAAGLTTVDSAPPWPSAPHRGRISIAPGRLSELGCLLASSTDVDWLAEIGVGTVHVGADHEDDLRAARDVTERLGGWLLREHGAPGLDGFGRPLPNAALSARVKEAFDPTGKLAPGRMEFVDARSPAAGEQVEVSRG